MAKEEVRHGIPMDEESKAEYEQAWKDIQDCFDNLEVIKEEENERRISEEN